jgi:hypothetical protein
MIDGASKQMLEHRYVMEEHLGRKLRTSEIVHHKDGNGLNNSIDNLELMSQAIHQNEHLMIGPHKWPLDEAIELSNAGWSLKDIADKYGVAWTSIRKAFYLRGIPTTDKRWGNPKWDIEKAKTMLAEGKTLKAIAQAVGISAPAVRMAFIKRGLKKPE